MIDFDRLAGPQVNELDSVATDVTSKEQNVQTAAQEIDADSEKTLPTEEENATLRRVADNLPWISFTLCLVEFAERASYYGAKTVYSNFIEYPLPAGKYDTPNLFISSILLCVKAPSLYSDSEHR